MKPIAFSPGSITCFLHILMGTHPLKTRSRGVAVNIREGVAASLGEAGQNGMSFNGTSVSMPTVSRVIEALAPKPIEVNFESPLPIGCGFGVSAACALSCAFALNCHFELQKSRVELAKLCHVAEVTEGTGAGDVCSQITGGIVHRRCLEGPLDARQIPLPVPDFYCSSFGPIETKSVLHSSVRLEELNLAGKKVLQKIERKLETISWEEILDASWEFSQQCGLLTEEVRTVVLKVRERGGKGFMIMIGNSVLSTQQEGLGKEAWKTNIDWNGTRLLT